MNADEIIQEFKDYLKEIEELPWGNHQILCDQAATMLRQQQAELDSLRSVVYWLKENRPEVWDDIKKWSKM